jgi:hypothetical protein
VTNNPSSAGELSLKPPSRMSFGRAKTQVGMSSASSNPGAVLKLRLHAPAPLSFCPLHQRRLVLHRRLCLVLCQRRPFYMGNPSTPWTVRPARRLDFNDAFIYYSVHNLLSRQGSFCS